MTRRHYCLLATVLTIFCLCVLLVTTGGWFIYYAILAVLNGGTAVYHAVRRGSP